MSEPADKKLYTRVKKLADSVYEKPSAYKSGFIVKKYKELGGKFIGKSPAKKEGLTRWFKEKWVNQHGTSGYKHKNDVYRPSKRITKNTPVTWSELSASEVSKAMRAKSRGKRIRRFKSK
jgi:hypothetical protein